MADEQISVAAPGKYTEFVIWQTGLHRHRYKIFTIKFLYTIRKGQPAKVVPVKFNIADSALQQPFIYIIAESVIPADRLRQNCRTV